jgi:hypothetical protein
MGRRYLPLFASLATPRWARGQAGRGIAAPDMVGLDAPLPRSRLRHRTGVPPWQHVASFCLLGAFTIWAAHGAGHLGQSPEASRSLAQAPEPRPPANEAPADPGAAAPPEVEPFRYDPSAVATPRWTLIFREPSRPPPPFDPPPAPVVQRNGTALAPPDAHSEAAPIASAPLPVPRRQSVARPADGAKPAPRREPMSPWRLPASLAPR